MTTTTDPGAATAARTVLYNPHGRPLWATRPSRDTHRRNIEVLSAACQFWPEAQIVVTAEAVEVFSAFDGRLIATTRPGRR